MNASAITGLLDMRIILRKEALAVSDCEAKQSKAFSFDALPPLRTAIVGFAPRNDDSELLPRLSAMVGGAAAL
jgi:hypothetical protein